MALLEPLRVYSQPDRPNRLLTIRNNRSADKRKATTSHRATPLPLLMCGLKLEKESGRMASLLGWLWTRNGVSRSGTTICLPKYRPRGLCSDSLKSVKRILRHHRAQVGMMSRDQEQTPDNSVWMIQRIPVMFMRTSNVCIVGQQHG